MPSRSNLTVVGLPSAVTTADFADETAGLQHLRGAGRRLVIHSVDGCNVGMSGKEIVGFVDRLANGQAFGLKDLDEFAALLLKRRLRAAQVFLAFSRSCGRRQHTDFVAAAFLRELTDIFGLGLT